MNKLFSTLLLSLLLMGSAFAQDADIVKKGQQAPDFSYKTEDGKTHKLSELKGKVVLINFFATWCGPCRAELPVLQEKVWDKYGKNDKFVLLVFGREHTDVEVKDFKTKNAYRMPMMADPGRAIYKQFATQLIPRNYLIDSTGKVVYLSNGYTEEEFNALLQMLKKLLP